MMDISKFIYYKEGVFSDEYCDMLVNLFDKKEQDNQTEVGSMMGGINFDVKNTTELNLYNFPDLVNHENFFSVLNHHLSNEFLGNLPFHHTFPAENKIFPGSNTYETCQIQKYKKGEGHYSSWHIEIENLGSSKRVFSMIVYLNDVYEGGETQFLYPGISVKPKKGSLVIFPSAYPFVHRGVKPVSNDKYIIATWIIYLD